MTENRRVAVTGASGFIGINLVEHLCDHEFEVHAIGHSEPSTWRHLDPRARAHSLDLTDPASATAIASLRPDAIVHLAAGPSKAATPEERRLALEVDVLGAQSIVEATEASGCHLVSAGSSFEAVASNQGPPFRAISKAAASAVVRQSGGTAAILRIARVYGPWEQPTRLLFRLLETAGTDEVIALTSDEATRSYVYVDDVCQAFALAIAQPGPYEVDVGGETRLPPRAVAEAVQRVTGRQLRYEVGAYPMSAIDRFVPPQDLATTQEILGWRPSTSLDQGIALMDQWFQSYRGSWPV